jgi:Phage capsid family.
MLEDGIIDLISYHAELAGYEFADNEESLIVAQLDAAATASSNTVANSNATLPLSDITASMQQLEEKNYMPTHMIVGVEVVNDLRNLDIFNEAHKTGGPSAMNQRMVGMIYGMKVIMSNNVSAKLAYIIDRNHAFFIAEKRPITVERYADYARDSSFIAVTQRLAVQYFRAEATSEITTT